MKVGDKVRMINDHYSRSNFDAMQKGTDYILTRVFSESFNHRGFIGRLWAGKTSLCDDSSEKYGYEVDLQLINNINPMVNVKEQFLLAVTKEPMKSFRKAGITNGDDLLTDDGAKVFLSWLLQKNSTEFKAEVVNDILAEIDKEKK